MHLVKKTFDDVHSPAHYGEGRSIEPISVIEMWRLTHHLACSLKYISRAGRKLCEKKDIEKSIWYLDRFMRYGIQADDKSFIDLPEKYSPLEVSLDWQLGNDLSMAVTHLFQAPLGVDTHHVEQAKKFLESRLRTLAIVEKNKISELKTIKQKGKN